MIKILDKKNCTGCGACANICPHNCISMCYDEEGFLYPKVDEKKCVECHLCEKICPLKKPLQPSKKPLDIEAAINANEEIRLESSSGGVFSSLADYVLDSGGIVVGAAYAEDWDVEHIVISSKTELNRLRGSKYVQSQTKNIYKQIFNYLLEGKLVLFSGTPCQISGLKSFLKKEYDNLITIEIFCHGVPSTLVYKKYIHEISNGEPISYVNMRAKPEGWKQYHFAINNYSVAWRDDLYMKAFVGDLTLRPSCYDCKHKDGRSGSDIGLGDFWGVKAKHKELDDDKGLSLIFLYSEKGKSILEQLTSIKRNKIEYDDAIKYNKGVSGIIQPHKKRNVFFKKLNTTNSIIKLLEKSFRLSMWERYKYILATWIYKIIH